MATILAANTLPSSASQTSYTNAAFTPVAGDHLIAYVIATDCTTDGSMSDSQNLGWVKISSVVSHGTNRLIVFRSKTTAAAVSTTLTWTCDPQLPTACLIATLRANGSDGNVRQVANNTGLASVTPSITFGANCLTTSAIVLCLVNKSNPHGTTQPANFGARNGGAVNGPTTAIATSSRNSGHTTNSATWASLSPTDWTVLGIEILNAGVGRGASGDLIGSQSTLTGSASRASSSVSHSASGSLAGEGGSIAASSNRFRSISGASTLAGSGAQILGAATRSTAHQTSGDLTGPGASLSGSGLRFRAHDSTAVLSGSSATLTATGSRYRTLTSAGTLTVEGGSLSGEALKYRAFQSGGSLSGEGGSLIGEGIRYRAHDSTGELLNDVGEIAGSGSIVRTHYAGGALMGEGGALVGLARSQGAPAISTTIGAAYGALSISAIYIERPVLFNAKPTSLFLNARLVE